MKLKFPIIGLSEYKIGLNTPINNITLPGYIFCFDETKRTHGGTGFFINEKYLYTKQSELLLTLICLKKRTSSVAASIDTLTCQ